MTVTVYNDPQRSDISIGTNDDKKNCLLGFWYSCTAINTGNLIVRQCIITPQLHLEETHEIFGNYG